MDAAVNIRNECSDRANGAKFAYNTLVHESQLQGFNMNSANAAGPMLQHPISPQGGYLRTGAAPHRRPRTKIFAVTSYWLFLFIIITNANVFTEGMTGENQALSLIALALMLFPLFAFRFAVLRPIGTPGVLWLLGVTLYLLISTRLFLDVDLLFLTSLGSEVYGIITGLFVICCSAVVTAHLAQTWSVNTVLRVLFVLFMIGISSVFLYRFAPWAFQYVESSKVGRQQGLYQSPNIAASVCGYAIAVGYALMVRERKLLVFVMLGIGFAAGVLMVAASRAHILFFPLLLGVQFFANRLSQNKLAVVILPIIALLGVGILVGRQQYLAEHRRTVERSDTHQRRMNDLFKIAKGDIKETTASVRLVVAAEGIQLISRYPFIGKGWYELHRMPQTNLSPHNTLLMTAGEGGLLPPLIMVLGMILLLREGIICRDNQVRAFVINFVAYYAMCNMVHDSLLIDRRSQMLMGTALGFLYAAKLMSRPSPNRQRMQAQAMQSAQLAGY